MSLDDQVSMFLSHYKTRQYKEAYDSFLKIKDRFIFAKFLKEFLDSAIQSEKYEEAKKLFDDETRMALLNKLAHEWVDHCNFISNAFDKSDRKRLDQLPKEFQEEVKAINLKRLQDKFGSAGPLIYGLIDGKATAADIKQKAGITEQKLVEIIDYMDEQGIVMLSCSENVTNKITAPKEKAPVKIEVVSAPPRITLANVGGMKKLKETRLLEILAALNAEAKEYNVSFGGGIILYGPPGCGKSLLTEAIAGETGVTFLQVNIADILNKWVGDSEKNLHAIFETARKKQPAIILFDEIEALGGSREAMDHHWERTLINQFLVDMDQIEKRNEKVLIIGTTNAPWHVDHALRRSGRFSEMVFIGPPDEKERIEIFKLHTKNIRRLEKIDCAKLAEITSGLSGADIAQVCKETARKIFMESIKTNKVRHIKTKDFVEIIEQGKKDGRFRSVHEWMEIAKRYSNIKSGKKEKELAMFG